MSAPKTDLSTLLERVRGASEGDRELDADLARFVLGLNVWEEPVMDFHTGRSERTTPVMSATHDGSETHRFFDGIPEWTSGLDAALALCERVLPGWSWAVFSRSYDRGLYLGGPAAAVTRPVSSVLFENMTRAKTPALALCAVILSAKIAEQENP